LVLVRAEPFGIGVETLDRVDRVLRLCSNLTARLNGGIGHKLPTGVLANLVYLGEVVVTLTADGVSVLAGNVDVAHNYTSS